MVDGYSKTSVIYIGDIFVEVSQTDRKIPLVVFDNYIYKKCILIGSFDVAIDLLNYNILVNLKWYPTT